MRKMHKRGYWTPVPHFTKPRTWNGFRTIRMSGTVWLSNEQESAIAGIKEVSIQLPNDNMITMHQVWHVPALKRSLVSIGMLAEDGYRTTLSESSWMINGGNMEIRNGYKYNNLYPLMVTNLEGALMLMYYWSFVCFHHSCHWESEDTASHKKTLTLEEHGFQVQLKSWDCKHQILLSMHVKFL